jgi:5'-deoxynucleotidase YfbR-like HD superfamily hydrolase
MSCISRYSQSYLLKPENVLEHTGFVAMLAYSIGVRLVIAGERIDFGKLLSKAVVHDMDEVITGDIPKTTKYANSTLSSLIHQFEDENMQKVSADVFCSMKPYIDWKEAKDDTKEGMIIRLCDSLAVVYKAWHEWIFLGNRSIKEFVLSVRESIDRMSFNLELFEKPEVMQDIIDESIELCDEVLR